MSPIIKSIIVFFSLYDLSLKVAPSLSLGKIMILIVSLYILSKSKYRERINIRKNEILSLILYGLILIYIFLLYILNGMPEVTSLACIIYFIIKCIWMSIVYECIFENKYEFIKHLAIAVGIQSLFVMISWFSAGYREIIANLLVQGGNIPLTNAKRPPGLMNSAGANASVTVALGAIAALYVSVKEKDSKLRNKYLIIFTLSSVAVFILGRTGLLVLIAMLVLFAISYYDSKIFIKNITTVCTIGMVAFAALYIVLPSESKEMIDYKIKWVTEELSEGIFESKTFDALKNHMTVKELGVETIVGTSRIRLPDGYHDSGYIQSYHAMGLVFSIIFYTVTLYYTLVLMYNSRNTLNNWILIIGLIGGIYILEVKEPFMFYYDYMLILFSLFRITNKSNHISQKI